MRFDGGWWQLRDDKSQLGFKVCGGGDFYSFFTYIISHYVVICEGTQDFCIFYNDF